MSSSTTTPQNAANSDIPVSTTDDSNDTGVSNNTTENNQKAPQQRERSISNGNFRARSTSAAQQQEFHSNQSISTEQKQRIEQEFSELFSSVGETIKSELQLHFNELQFQENVNKMALEEYQKMIEESTVEHENIQKLRAEFELMIPFLKEIDEVESEVEEMRKAVKMMDGYTRQLEKQLKPYF